MNAALLTPASRRASPVGLVEALSAHYGSPGRQTDYRQQFERTTTSGEDPSIFATALETLAIKALGDMDQTARLRSIRDRFIAGHRSCELRRHLDSVSPETPIRILLIDTVWESHADLDVRRASKPGPDPTFPTYAVGCSDGGWMICGHHPTVCAGLVGTLFRRLLASTAAGGGGGGAATRISSLARPQDPGEVQRRILPFRRRLQCGQGFGPGHRWSQNIRKQSECLRWLSLWCHPRSSWRRQFSRS